MKLRFLVFVWVLLGWVLPALAQSDETMKPHGGITSAKAFDVSIHMVYEERETGTYSVYQKNATSDWTGMVRLSPNLGRCLWEGPLNVQADATEVFEDRANKHLNIWTAHGNGRDQQEVNFRMFADGTYGFSFGQGWVAGPPSSLQCERGTCQPNQNPTNVTYCVPLTIRLPLPKGALSLSGSKSFPADSGSGKITLSWSFTPVGKEIKL